MWATNQISIDLQLVAMEENTAPVQCFSCLLTENIWSPRIIWIGDNWFPTDTSLFFQATLDPKITSQLLTRSHYQITSVLCLCVAHLYLLLLCNPWSHHNLPTHMINLTEWGALHLVQVADETTEKPASSTEICSFHLNKKLLFQEHFPWSFSWQCIICLFLLI